MEYKENFQTLWTDVQKSLGVAIKYSPIYHPQTNGLVERSHQTLKTSIRANLTEMGDTYRDKWIKYLPWVLLGINSAYNTDLDTSSIEMTLGMPVQLPGQILMQPSEEFDVKALLEQLQIKANRPALPPSLNVPNHPVNELPTTVTHVCTLKSIM